MPVTPLINGVNYAWANVTLVLFSVPVIGITKIEYKKKQKKENNYGAGSQPVSRGYGNYEYEGSIELYLDEWKKIIAASPDRDPMQIGYFDIPVVFGGSRLTAERDILRACEFTEEGLSASQGDTKLLISLPLIIGSIDR
jgi:hypothetical protein